MCIYFLMCIFPEQKWVMYLCAQYRAGEVSVSAVECVAGLQSSSITKTVTKETLFQTAPPNCLISECLLNALCWLSIMRLVTMPKAASYLEFNLQQFHIYLMLQQKQNVSQLKTTIMELSLCLALAECPPLLLGGKSELQDFAHLLSLCRFSDLGSNLTCSLRVLHLREVFCYSSVPNFYLTAVSLVH